MHRTLLSHCGRKHLYLNDGHEADTNRKERWCLTTCWLVITSSGLRWEMWRAYMERKSVRELSVWAEIHLVARDVFVNSFFLYQFVVTFIRITEFLTHEPTDVRPCPWLHTHSSVVPRTHYRDLTDTSVTSTGICRAHRAVTCEWERRGPSECW